MNIFFNNDGGDDGEEEDYMSVYVRCGFWVCYHTGVEVRGQLESWFSPSISGSGAQTHVLNMHTFFPNKMAHVHYFYHHTAKRG